MTKTSIDYYGERQIKLAFDLMNILDPYFEYPERVAGLEDAHTFLLEHGFQVERRLSDADLATIRQLSVALRDVIEAEQDEMAADRLNELLEGALVRASVVAEAGDNWRIELAAGTGGGLDPVAWLAAEAALGLALALQLHGRDRLRSCAADPCREVFIDLSRNRSRRYCSDRCANRHNVAAFRERARSKE